MELVLRGYRDIFMELVYTRIQGYIYGVIVYPRIQEYIHGVIVYPRIQEYILIEFENIYMNYVSCLANRIYTLYIPIIMYTVHYSTVYALHKLV